MNVEALKERIEKRKAMGLSAEQYNKLEEATRTTEQRRTDAELAEELRRFVEEHMMWRRQLRAKRLGVVMNAPYPY